MEHVFDFRVLGPMVVSAGETAIPLRSPKHRVLLATLLLDAGRPVSVPRLAEAIWGTRQPDYPRRAIQLYVTRLRALLGATTGWQPIVTETDNYLVDVVPEQTDLGRVEKWALEADRAAGHADPEREATALGRALAQWKGEPLCDIPSEQLHRENVPRLREQRLHLLERRIDVELRLGRHPKLIAELMRLTARHPLRERFWAQLVTALYRDGRRTEALAAFHTGRGTLVDELGVQPSDDLRRLHAAILAGEGLARAPHSPIPRAATDLDGRRPRS